MRIVVAEDSALLREGLVRILVEAGFDVVGRAGDAVALLELVRRERPDVAVVDIRMPPTHTKEGLVAAATIQEQFPSVGVLVLSAHLDEHQAAKLLEAGTGAGYLLKDSVMDPDQFLGAVRTVGGGGLVVDPQLVRSLSHRARLPSRLDSLTERERGVLALMAEGCANSAICDGLYISAKTVEGHIRSIFTKLDLPETEGAHRRVLAVLTYLRSGE